MKIFSTSHTHGAHGLKGPHTPKSASSGSSQQPDQVEISPAAQEAAQLAEAAEARAAERIAPADGGIRADLVARLRSEIDAGKYETPDKLDAALDRLLDQQG